MDLLIYFGSVYTWTRSIPGFQFNSCVRHKFITYTISPIPSFLCILKLTTVNPSMASLLCNWLSYGGGPASSGAALKWRRMVAVRAESINPDIRKTEDKVVDSVVVTDLAKPVTAYCRFSSIFLVSFFISDFNITIPLLLLHFSFDPLNYILLKLLDLYGFSSYEF